MKMKVDFQYLQTNQLISQVINVTMVKHNVMISCGEGLITKHLLMSPNMMIQTGDQVTNKNFMHDSA